MDSVGNGIAEMFQFDSFLDLRGFQNLGGLRLRRRCQQAIMAVPQNLLRELTRGDLMTH
jgi:hypothetical protein